MNIAVLEDEVIIALYLKETIEDLEHNFVGMFDSANSIFGSLKDDIIVDIVFVDIKINGNLDGIQTSIKLKEKYPNVKIIFITSYKDSNTIARAKEVKPSGYLIKPIIKNDIEAILMVIEANSETPNDTLIHISGYKYDKDLQEIFENDEVIHLSKKEKICLHSLVENVNSYTYQDKLILDIWNGENNRIASLRELLFRLRKKLPNLDIKSISNTGYILSDK